MCESCWVKHGAPVVWNEDIAEAAELVRRLYALEPMGGPLHVQLEDMNLDMDMTPMYVIPGNQYGPETPDRYSAEVHEICDAIQEIMEPMTEGWRASVVAHYEGWAVNGHVVRYGAGQTDAPAT
jgi:hypothetical protein